MDAQPRERLLSPSEFAERAGVDARTVSRWSRERRLDGRVTTLWTEGGHRRFRESEVDAYLTTDRAS